jgi:co-chaperonin GroES (HSP10)
MKAINDFLIIDPVKAGPKNIGGLILTEELDTTNRFLKATIISVGNLIEGLKEGDVIYYDKNAGHGITWKDKMYAVIRGRDIFLVD